MYAPKSIEIGELVQSAANGPQLPVLKPADVTNCVPPRDQIGALQVAPQSVETTTDNVSPV